ncbi:hypothetical protein GCK72_016404 [Caenorhabditis remanei]|uniref:Uncharacterized protein n=1 Tax=Caenorhabditis remanei TaxID=31234 RepID=A0A6A5G5T7_CAERE|nr:hypothetical protein GCK72_016404 [Caenorhabditis remanei]KAF1749859.1 hypothetical protein GCK72_016404 [Caenorhabditis remanei]
MSSSLSQSKETRTKSDEVKRSNSRSDDTKSTSTEEIIPIKKTSNATTISNIGFRSMTNLALENMGLDTRMEGPTWTSKWEAITATLAFITCSGNFWFFPFLCGYYGGWFPYQFTFCFVFIAVPLLYMETALGQYASASPLSVFSRMAPAMAGLSAGMCFIMVFRTISLSVWAIYDLTITAHATRSIWEEPVWMSCPMTESAGDYCVDYRLANECTWVKPGFSVKCDRYQEVLIATRGFQQRKSPFMSFVHGLMFKRSITVNDWAPPSNTSIISAVVLWIIVGVISIGGSKVLGRTGIIALTLLSVGSLMLLGLGMSLGESRDVFVAFFYQKDSYEDKWMWVWSWADAAAHALRALNVGCGGIQKFASLNNFHNKIQRDVLIISGISYIFYMCTGLFSFMYMAAVGRFYYPDLEASERIQLYATPVMIESVISEMLTNCHFGKFWVFFFWLTLAACSIQGISSYIWVISSMLIERMNGSRRKYGKPLASWHKRAIILAIMCLTGLVSSLPYLGNGGINLMSSITTFASYGTIFIAFVEIITVSYLYGFKRFSVNIRAMIGGRGPPNMFWWLNWLVISPILLIITFGCIVATFGQKKAFNEISIVTDPIGYTLLIMPFIFVVFYFLRDECDRRRKMEPFVVMIRATGDWGPMNLEDRRMAVKYERQLRVRY